MPVVKHEDQEFELSHSEEQKLNEFQMITSFPPEELPNIIKLLKNHSWQLEQALGRYFDGNWKSNLDLASFSDTESPEPQLQDSLLESQGSGERFQPFIANNLNLVPTLPIMSQLPHDYKERFQIIGLRNSKSSNVYARNAFLFAIMFLPNMIVKLGTHILSWVGFLISYALGLNLGADNSLHAMVIPENPDFEVKPTDVRGDVEAILGESANDLMALCSEKSFNELFQYCETNFKFLVVILLGSLNGESIDQNSYTFVKRVLGHRSTISLLQSYKDNMEIYIGSVHSPEAWVLAKQLKLRYSLNCVMAAKVLNRTGSLNGLQQMSVLGSAVLKNHTRFQGSLKSLYNRYSPELVVSSTEKHEVEMARKIKEMQDRAYEESLNHDRMKKEKREREAEEKEIARQEQLRGEELERLKESLHHVCMLKECLKLIKEEQSNLNEKVATIQIRTADGRRIIRKFYESSTLRDVYLAVASHLYLNHYTTDKVALLGAIVSKIRTLCEDTSLLCFKDNALKNGKVLEECSLDELKIIIEDESSNISAGADAELNFDFELVSPFPRYNVPNDAHIELRSVAQLWPNGSLLIESLEGNTTDDEN